MIWRTKKTNMECIYIRIEYIMKIAYITIPNVTTLQVPEKSVLISGIIV